MLLSWVAIIACKDSSGPLRVKDVVVTIDKQVVTVGGTATLTAELLNEGRVLTDRVITWSSTAPAVATVAGTGDVATLTALSSGTATISAKSEGVTGTLSISVVTYSQVVRTDAPIAYWRFEETVGMVAADSSGHNHHADFVDSPVINQALGTRTGRAFAFQSGSDGVVAQGGLWTALTSLTAEAWIRASSVTSQEGMIILDKGGSWNLLIAPDGRPVFHFPHTADQVFGPTPILAGQAYHVVGTFAQGVMKIYVNGELAGESAVLVQAVPAPTPDAPIHVGRGLSAGRWEFFGIVDEPAGYNNVLSAEAILRHYDAGK